MAGESTLGENLGGSSVRAASRHSLASSVDDVGAMGAEGAEGAVGAEGEVGSVVPCNALGSPAGHVVASDNMDADPDGSHEEDAGSHKVTVASFMDVLVGKEIRVGDPCTEGEGFGSEKEGEGLDLGQNVLLE